MLFRSTICLHMEDAAFAFDKNVSDDPAPARSSCDSSWSPSSALLMESASSTSWYMGLIQISSTLCGASPTSSLRLPLPSAASASQEKPFINSTNPNNNAPILFLIILSTLTFPFQELYSFL